MKTHNLSLAEAHASGKNYRRTAWGKCSFIRYNESDLIKVGNAIAADYELEPEAKSLTRQDVEAAVDRWLIQIGIRGAR